VGYLWDIYACKFIVSAWKFVDRYFLVSLEGEFVVDASARFAGSEALDDYWSRQS
jgi:hypothetical protein